MIRTEPPAVDLMASRLTAAIEEALRLLALAQERRKKRLQSAHED